MAAKGLCKYIYLGGLGVGVGRGCSFVQLPVLNEAVNRRGKKGLTPSSRNVNYFVLNYFSFVPF